MVVGSGVCGWREKQQRNNNTGGTVPFLFMFLRIKARFTDCVCVCIRDRQTDREVEMGREKGS